MSEGMIIRAKIKEFVTKTEDGKKTRISDDFCDALNAKVEGIVKDACQRAKQNNRRTVMPRDL